MKRTLALLIELDNYQKNLLIDSKSLIDFKESIDECEEAEKKMQTVVETFKISNKRDTTVSSDFFLEAHRPCRKISHALYELDEVLVDTFNNYVKFRQLS